MSEIRVDTISEKTSANGVAVDSLAIKDGKITNLMNATLSAADLGVGLHIKSADSGASVDGSADELVIEGSANTGISILSGASNSGSIYFGDSGLNYDGYIAYSQANRNFSFGTAGGAKLSISSTGVITHTGGTATSTSDLTTGGLHFHDSSTADGAIMPITFTPSAQQIELEQGIGFISQSQDGSAGFAADIAFYTRGAADGSTLGTSDERVRIHSEGVMAASAGVALGVGTANTASNVLDDYEEGTWLVPSGAVNGITYVVSATGGRTYTKIGRQVTIHAHVQFGGHTADNNATYLGTLPFTPLAGGTFVGKVRTSSDITGCCVEINGGESFIRLMKDSGGSYDYVTRAESASEIFEFTVTYFV